MRRQARLLEYLVGKWDPEIQAFRIGLHILKIDLEEILFITGLSKRGSHVIMSGHKNVEETTADYIATYCVSDTDKKSGKISIKEVTNMPLRTILFTIVRDFGSTSSHHATKAQMTYALECIEPRVFNWCEGSLVKLQDVLTRCRTGKKK